MIDLSRTKLGIYSEFKRKIPGNVLELGFGNGKPIAEDLLESGFEYIGIDISERQLELAGANLPKCRKSFIRAEMLDYCKNEEPDSVGGTIAMFSIFHLPREKHVELFSEIQRILKHGAPLLFTCHPSNWEGVENDWMEAPEMFWSNFSNRWYKLTLTELGYTFISAYRKITVFNNMEEIQYFLLFVK